MALRTKTLNMFHPSPLKDLNTRQPGSLEKAEGAAGVGCPKLSVLPITCGWNRMVCVSPYHRTEDSLMLGSVQTGWDV